MSIQRAATGWIPAMGLMILALSPPTVAAPRPDELPLEARLALERGRALDDILQAIAELPARDEALRLVGRSDSDRERIINRLLDLRGPLLGAEPESMAVAAGLLDLLLGDQALREQPEYHRLERAAEAALRSLVIDRPRLRARAAAQVQELNILPEPHRSGRAGAAPDSPLRPGVTPLPRTAAPAAGSVLLEAGERREWTVPPGTRPRWIPGTHQILLIEADRLRRIDLEAGDSPMTLGPIRSGAPVALSTAGDYVATATTAPGDSLDRLALYRLGESANCVVLETPGRIAALAWSPRALKLAVAGSGGLTVRDLDRPGPLRTTLPFSEIVAGRTSLHWSPDGNRLLVAFRTRAGDSPGNTPAGFRLSLLDPARGTRLDSLVVDDGLALSWAPDSRALWLVTRDRGLLGIELRADRLAEPRPIALPFDTEGAPERLGLKGLAFSPDGRHLALDAAPGASFREEALTFDNGLLRSSLVYSAGSRAALLSRADSADAGQPRPQSSASDPRGPGWDRIVWHPSSRWLTLAHRGNLGYDAVDIIDRVTGDGQGLGGNAVTEPAFSPDGRFVSWLEAEWPGGTRLRVRPLVQTAGGVDAAWLEAARGTDALNPGRVEEAVVCFRNAVRLAPEVASHRLGLARAYRAVAETYPEPALMAFYLEAAARAAASAFLLDTRTPEIRLEFYDLVTLRAVSTGVVRSRELRARVEADLVATPRAALYEAPESRASRILDRLAAARQWNPADEMLGVLYEGLAARWRSVRRTSP